MELSYRFFIFHLSRQPLSILGRVSWLLPWVLSIKLRTPIPYAAISLWMARVIHPSILVTEVPAVCGGAVRYPVFKKTD